MAQRPGTREWSPPSGIADSVLLELGKDIVGPTIPLQTWAGTPLGQQDEEAPGGNVTGM